MPRPETEPYRGLACGAREGICRHDGRTQRRATASTHPKQENPNSPQRQRSARIRNRETPARFTPTKLWQAAGIGWADVTALSKTVRHQPFQRHVTAPSVTREHASETGKPQQDSGPTGCHLVGRAAAVWHLKSKGGRVKQEALASSRHWLGERNGLEQHRAASAVPKARHSPQRHP